LELVALADDGSLSMINQIDGPLIVVRDGRSQANISADL
jgi:hypothetical protein